MKYLDNVGKRAIALVGVTLALAAPACGDDDKKKTTTDGSVSPDGPSSDAQQAVPSGAVSVSEIRVSNPELGPQNLAGGAILATFTDSGSAESPLGRCVVTEYPASAWGAAGSIDQGAVTVKGSGHGRDITCSFNAAAMRYLCALEGGAVATGSVAIDDPTDTTLGKVAYKIIGANFDTYNPVGAHLQVSGFDNDKADTPAGKTFPIIAKTATDTVVVINKAMEGETPALPEATDASVGATYAVLAGAGPIPAALATTPVEFLDPATAIQIIKPNGNPIGAFDVQLKPSGSNAMMLKSDPGYHLPHAMPTTPTAADFKIGCMSGCDAAQNELTGIIINGRTTDAPNPSTTDPTEMAPPVNKFAVFTCATIGPEHTIKKAEWDKVLATNPTRIETRVFYNSAKQGVATYVNIVAGHGLVGYTTAQ